MVASTGGPGGTSTTAIRVPSASATACSRSRSLSAMPCDCISRRRLSIKLTRISPTFEPWRR
jgi:hypothetical protein